MFNKLLYGFWILLFAFDSALALSYRNALQISEEYIEEINNIAVKVNELSCLDLEGGGAYLEKEDTVVCAFSKNKINAASASSLASVISERFSDKEIILTGYGKAAQFAASVASCLRYEALAVNQLKLITFCGEGRFDSLEHMCLSCKLNFSHKIGARDYRRSPMLELPIPLSSEVFSMNGLLPSIVSGSVCGLIGYWLTPSCEMFNKWFKCSETALELPFICTGVAVGALAAKICSLYFSPSEYLPAKGVKSVFLSAKYGSWDAMTEKEWRMLGQ